MTVGTWLREGLREAFARAASPQRSMAARVVNVWQQGKPLPRHDDYVALATHLVRKNVLVASCIWELVTSAAEPELVAEQRKVVDGKETWVRLPDSHDLPTLLNRPNPEESQDELLERLLTHQQIGGQWNLRKERSSSGRLVELWAMRPDRVEVIPGADGLVAGYAFKDDQGKRTPMDKQNVTTCMLRADPLDDFYGLSPLSVLALFGDLDNKAAEYLRTFFYNGGAPAGLLKLKNVVLETADRQRLKQTWQEEHAGERGWHTVSVLDADAEYQEIGSRPEQLKMEAIWDETEARICGALGVPPILVGCHVGLKRATYANYAEARTSFWEETMTPLLRRTNTKLTMGVAHEWGGDFRIRHDLANVPALQKDQVESRAAAVNEYNAGMLTLNEARVKCGYPELEGDEGTQRKAASAPPAGGPADLGSQFGDLLGRVATLERHSTETHGHNSRAVAKRRTELRDAAARYFGSMGPDLVAHLKSALENAG